MGNRYIAWVVIQLTGDVTMERSEVLSLVIEAQTAADPRYSGLSDYRDLQDLLKRLSYATEELLKEVEELDGRLHRTAIGAPPAKRERRQEIQVKLATRPSGKRHVA